MSQGPICGEYGGCHIRVRCFASNSDTILLPLGHMTLSMCNQKTEDRSQRTEGCVSVYKSGNIHGWNNPDWISHDLIVNSWMMNHVAEKKTVIRIVNSLWSIRVLEVTPAYERAYIEANSYAYWHCNSSLVTIPSKSVNLFREMAENTGGCLWRWPLCVILTERFTRHKRVTLCRRRQTSSRAKVEMTTRNGELTQLTR
jgi:hypothetical protein